MAEKTYRRISNCSREEADKIIRAFIQSENLIEATDPVSGEPFYHDAISGKGFSYAYDDFGAIHLWWFFGLPSSPRDPAKEGGFSSQQAAIYLKSTAALEQSLLASAPQNYTDSSFQPVYMSYAPSSGNPQWALPATVPPVAVASHQVPAAELLALASRPMDASRNVFAVGALVLACLALLICFFASFTAGSVFAILVCVMSANAFKSTYRILPIIALAIACLTFAVMLMRVLGVF